MPTHDDAALLLIITEPGSYYLTRNIVALEIGGNLDDFGSIDPTDTIGARIPPDQVFDYTLSLWNTSDRND